jgi:hypothetical protein
MGHFAQINDGDLHGSQLEIVPMVHVAPRPQSQPVSLRINNYRLR